MIRSFDDLRTSDAFHGIPSAEAAALPAAVRDAATRTLDLLDAAHTLEDLRSARPRSLKPLEGKPLGWLSLRVWRVWRLVFRWRHGSALDVALRVRLPGKPTGPITEGTL